MPNLHIPVYCIHCLVARQGVSLCMEGVENHTVLCHRKTVFLAVDEVHIHHYIALVEDGWGMLAAEWDNLVRPAWSMSLRRKIIRINPLNPKIMTTFRSIINKIIQLFFLCILLHFQFSPFLDFLF